MPEISLLGLDIKQFFTAEKLPVVLRSGVFVLIGIPLVLALSKAARRYLAKHYTLQHALVAAKIIKYLGLTIIIFSALKELGFELTPLLGAAGVVGIAVGFASQTSVSNLISGLFLLAEQPFVVEDVIEVGGTTGVVLSIDMLSVKLRTFDNRFVRIPNEIIVKSQVINISRFPIRRVDLNLGVAYKENIARVRQVLIEVAHKNQYCLREPEPLIIFSGFGNSSIDLTFAVWATKPDFLKLKNSIQEEIKARFDQEGIEIPFPHLSLYSGEATRPLPVQIVTPEAAGNGKN